MRKDAALQSEPIIVIPCYATEEHSRFARIVPTLLTGTEKTFSGAIHAQSHGSNPELLQARRATHNGPDLLDRILSRPGALEIQINVAADNGEPVDGKRSTYTDGEYEWFNIRIPKNAATTPEFHDYELRWPLDLHVEGIGWTGWDWQARRSRALGFDFDLIVGHAKGIGVSAEELERVKENAKLIPCVEARKSTGGGGIHLYTYFDEEGIPTANHTEHAALARCILGMMSSETGFDFASQIDACGGNMWFWHRKMTPENEGLKLIKPARRCCPCQTCLPTGVTISRSSPVVGPKFGSTRS